jgi:hypothetical protein
MPAITKKNTKEELLRALFVALAPKWDIHDRASAKNLAKQCLEMVEGFHDVVDPALSLPKKPEKPA